jgi:hypothetical protein
MTRNTRLASWTSRTSACCPVALYNGICKSTALVRAYPLPLPAAQSACDVCQCTRRVKLCSPAPQCRVTDISAHVLCRSERYCLLYSPSTLALKITHRSHKTALDGRIVTFCTIYTVARIVTFCTIHTVRRIVTFRSVFTLRRILTFCSIYTVGCIVTFCSTTCRAYCNILQHNLSGVL